MRKTKKVTYTEDKDSLIIVREMGGLMELLGLFGLVCAFIFLLAYPLFGSKDGKKIIESLSEGMVGAWVAFLVYYVVVVFFGLFMIRSVIKKVNRLTLVVSVHEILIYSTPLPFPYPHNRRIDRSQLEDVFWRYTSGVGFSLMFGLTGVKELDLSLHFDDKSIDVAEKIKLKLGMKETVNEELKIERQDDDE